MSTTKKDELAAAIVRCFEADLGGLYVANIVNVMNGLDNTVDKIGGEIQGRLGEIAEAINNLAEAIRETKSSS